MVHSLASGPFFGLIDEVENKSQETKQTKAGTLCSELTWSLDWDRLLNLSEP